MHSETNGFQSEKIDNRRKESAEEKKGVGWKRNRERERKEKVLNISLRRLPFELQTTVSKTRLLSKVSGY